ncbi:MAG: LysM peptidoglycan-binding domain-containing protein, partial [Gemmatimonadales bacterium]
ENNLRGNRILAGQRLRVPTYVDAAPTPAAAPVQARAAEVAEDGPGGVAAAQSSAPEASPGRSAASASDESPAGAGAHRVARGESLWTIARRYGVTEADLRRANGISGSRILVGQELTIPIGGSAAPASHRVARGESLWTIARRYGVTEADLRRANGISGSRILVGQQLTIPAGGSTGPAVHRVAQGESLWTIARRHGTTVDDLRRANGIGSSGRILPGQELLIPAGR